MIQLPSKAACFHVHARVPMFMLGRNESRCACSMFVLKRQLTTPQVSLGVCVELPEIGSAQAKPSRHGTRRQSHTPCDALAVHVSSERFGHRRSTIWLWEVDSFIHIRRAG